MSLLNVERRSPMQASVSDKYVQQITDIARELPEEKLRSVLALARRMKTEPQRPATPLIPKVAVPS